jgi:hypothetical protein
MQLTSAAMWSTALLHRVPHPAARVYLGHAFVQAMRFYNPTLPQFITPA